MSNASGCHCQFDGELLRAQAFHVRGNRDGARASRPLEPSLSQAQDKVVRLVIGFPAAFGVWRQRTSRSRRIGRISTRTATLRTLGVSAEAAGSSRRLAATSRDQSSTRRPSSTARSTLPSATAQGARLILRVSTAGGSIPTPGARCADYVPVQDSDTGFEPHLAVDQVSLRRTFKALHPHSRFSVRMTSSCSAAESAEPSETPAASGIGQIAGAGLQAGCWCSALLSSA